MIRFLLVLLFGITAAGSVNRQLMCKAGSLKTLESRENVGEHGETYVYAYLSVPRSACDLVNLKMRFLIKFRLIWKVFVSNSFFEHSKTHQRCFNLGCLQHVLDSNSPVPSRAKLLSICQRFFIEDLN